MIRVSTGNLLTAEAEALVNTVNTVGVMGKGIALQFKRAFPANFDAYEAACRHGDVILGTMFVVALDQLDGPRFIINFPTKGHWRARSRLADIDAGLHDLRRVVEERSIRSVAVPPLGCGNGGLDWSDVQPMIERVLGGIPGVDVQLFAPAGAPAPEAMPVRTARPPMTRFAAAILLAYDRYIKRSLEAGLAVEPKLSLLEAHKVAYFLQAAGWPLRLTFTQGHYGPYSESLNHFISAVEGHFLSGYGDGTSGSKAALTVSEDAIRAARSVMAGDMDFWEALSRLDDILDGFEFPYGIELLSTVHFAAHRLVGPEPSFEDVAGAINGWSTRKGRLFTDKQTTAAYGRLDRAGLLTSA